MKKTLFFLILTFFFTFFTEGLLAIDLEKSLNRILNKDLSETFLTAEKLLEEKGLNKKNHALLELLPLLTEKEKPIFFERNSKSIPALWDGFYYNLISFGLAFGSFEVGDIKGGLIHSGITVLAVGTAIAVTSIDEKSEIFQAISTISGVIWLANYLCSTFTPFLYINSYNKKLSRYLHGNLQDNKKSHFQIQSRNATVYADKPVPEVFCSFKYSLYRF